MLRTKFWQRISDRKSKEKRAVLAEKSEPPVLLIFSQIRAILVQKRENRRRQDVSNSND